MLEFMGYMEIKRFKRYNCLVRKNMGYFTMTAKRTKNQ
jgi:hypothetical protein